MLFPTHLVAGYLIGRHWALPLPWVIAGAALPDLIDKPMAIVGLFDLYHTVGHSLLTLVLLGIVATQGRKWFSLWVGWASHLGLDACQMIVNGRPEDVSFLLWPFVRHAPEVQLPPIEFAIYYVGTPAFIAEVGIWIVFVAIVVRDRFGGEHERSRPG